MRYALLATLVTALLGCTLIGVVQGVQSAGEANNVRARAIAMRDPDPPPEASAPLRALAYGSIGFAIDVVLTILIVPHVVPHE